MGAFILRQLSARGRHIFPDIFSASSERSEYDCRTAQISPAWWSHLAVPQLNRRSHAQSYERLSEHALQSRTGHRVVDDRGSHLRVNIPPRANRLWRNLNLVLNIQNLADRRPPFLAIPAGDLAIGRSAVPFDGTNASAVGRYVSLEIRKGWQ